jgi:N-acetylneuraminate synthase
MNQHPSVCIIAEAGVNHNGDLALALKLVDAAAEAGADAVKFQTFSAEQLATRSAPKAEYQTQTTNPGESQFEMLKKLELDAAAHRTLQEHCKRCGLEFISTPFDAPSVQLLDQLGVSRIKISSGDLTNAPLLLQVAETRLPILLSTGMATLPEVEAALGVLAFCYLGGKQPALKKFQDAYDSAEGKQKLRERVTLLHCTTEYPAPIDEVNLRAIDVLRQFGLPVGYSDHTEGIEVAVGAVALGAVVVEKHFTLDRNLPGPDHKASLLPAELKAMVAAIRKMELALGAATKGPTAAEKKNMRIARKSLVAAKNILAGESFTTENLTIKRPGSGVSPFHYWSLLGQPAGRDYTPDELIEL